MNAFRAIRKRLGISQAEVASALGMSQGNVSFYEQGRQNVPPEVAAKFIEFAKARGHAVTFDDLYAPLVTPQPAAA